MFRINVNSMFTALLLSRNFKNAFKIFVVTLLNKKITCCKVQKSHLPVLLFCINALQHTLYMFSESTEHTDVKTFKK